MTNLELLLLFATPAVGAFLGTYFSKRGEINFFKSHHEEVLSQLKETTKAVEYIRGEVDGINIIKQIKFEKYHSKQIDAIAVIYSDLYKFYRTYRSYHDNMAGGNPDDGRYKLAAESAIELKNTFDSNRIWIDEVLVTKFDVLFEYMYNRFIDSVFAEKYKRDSENIKQAEKDIDSLNITIFKEIPELLLSLNIAIKSLLNPEHD